MQPPLRKARPVERFNALGLSFEVFSASGMPNGTAKCYAHRGRRRLRARLAERAVA